MRVVKLLATHELTAYSYPLLLSHTTVVHALHYTCHYFMRLQLLPVHWGTRCVVRISARSDSMAHPGALIF
jgi:hypothetical protein